MAHPDWALKHKKKNTELRNIRGQLHSRIANILETEFPTTADSEPEVLARHHSMAGMIEPAIGYWRRAGEQSAEASANVEAISHFECALESIGALPETQARDQWELDLRIALGGPLLMTRGHGAPELLAQSAYADADTRPRIVITVPGTGGNVGLDMEVILEMWRQNLGVEVEIQQVEWATYLQDLNRKRFQAFGGLAWQADYPDPQDFLDILFHTESETNHGGYSNAEVDRLLEKARVE